MEEVIIRIAKGDYPHYITKNNTALFVSKKIDGYCRARRCKMLEYANGVFAGYSDDPKFTVI